jgi:hypothetical protein
LVAYGWDNGGEASVDSDRALLKTSAGRPSSLESRRTAYLGIGWDSSETGNRKLLNDGRFDRVGTHSLYRDPEAAPIIAGLFHALPGESPGAARRILRPYPRPRPGLCPRREIRARDPPARTGAVLEVLGPIVRPGLAVHAPPRTWICEADLV